MSQLLLTSYGDPRESLTLDRSPARPLGPDDVLVRMEAAPVNPSDVLLARGGYGLTPALPTPAGGEGVGQVVDAGGPAGRDLTGRRVIILPTYEQGTWADEVTVARRNVVPVSADADPLQLAMLPINPATAHLLLHRFAALEPGDWVGFDAANSGVGRCVAALAHRRGLRSLGIVRRPEAAQAVRDAGADRVILAGEEPIDVELALALDATMGPTTADLATALRYRGTLVTYAYTVAPAPGLRAPDLIFKEITHTGFWLLNWLREASRAELEGVYRPLGDLVAGGDLTVPVEATYPLTDYRAAIEHATTPARSGKILFRWPSR